MTPAAAELKLVPPPPGPLFRVGRSPDPFVWRDPRPLMATEDEAPLLTGNRFDAPHNEFRSLYFATEPYGCWLEKLAPLRPIADLPGRIDAAMTEPPDVEYDVDLAAVAVGPDFFGGLVLAEAFIDADARFVDVEHEDTLATLSQLVGLPFLTPFVLDRFDRGVAMSRDRRLTRALALELFALAGGAAVGLRYTSVHAAGVHCWSLWDTAGPLLHQRSLAAVDLTSRELREAADTLRIELPERPALPQTPGLPEPW
jgi:hypothetical protein